MSIDPIKLKRLTSTLLIGLLLASASAFGRQDTFKAPRTGIVAPIAEALSPKDRVDAFEDVWETINEKYYDPSFNGVNWRAVRERYRPLIERAGTDEDFYIVLKQMVGELHDAHTRFATPEERRERERYEAVSAGVFIFEVEGKPVIVGVEPDSEASRSGLQEGMLVLEIDGKPVADRLADARARVAGSSTDRAVQLRIYRLLIDGPSGSTLKLKVARADGSALEATFVRHIVADNAVVTSRRLPSGMGYIKLTLWKSPIRKQFKRALEEFRNAPGVIVDIRGNPGGEAEEVVKIASFFFNSHVSFGKFTSRSGKAIFFRTGDGDLVYKGPVAILVNEGSGSGSELFAGVMQENRRALIVGRRTCGCVLGISKFKKVKGGGELAVSELGYLSPLGKTFEGTGVIPNDSVPLTISDLQYHRDAALEEAERSLKTSVTNR